MNCRTFSQNPRTRGKSHHPHPLHSLGTIECQQLISRCFCVTLSYQNHKQKTFLRGRFVACTCCFIIPLNQINSRWSKRSNLNQLSLMTCFKKIFFYVFEIILHQRENAPRKTFATLNINELQDCKLILIWWIFVWARGFLIGAIPKLYRPLSAWVEVQTITFAVRKIHRNLHCFLAIVGKECWKMGYVSVSHILTVILLVYASDK